MKAPQNRAADSLARARARYAHTSAATVASDGQTLGPLLRQLRTGYGLSVRRLADGACVAPSTIQRLERGQFRPRSSTLARIAGALDPDRCAEIREQLVAAAGDDIAEDNAAWSRYAAARVDEALQAGRMPLPTASARAIRLSTAGDAMWHASMVLNERAAAVIDDPDGRLDELMCLSDALRAEGDLLEKAAGAFWRVTPVRRWRGDPVDVSPHPPSLADLRAVRRWLWEWQVREGRLRPRSARERAIAETGAREGLLQNSVCRISGVNAGRMDLWHASSSRWTGISR
jgi:transcriptional regulator with XRE-family HTH domain